MRVLHVLHTSLPYIAGYTIRSDYIVRTQRDQGIHPAVVTSAQQIGQDAPLDVVHGIPHFRTQPLQGKTPPLVREARLMAALERRVETAIQEWQPDVVHAHSPMLVGLPALYAARRAKLPLVYEVRDLWENASVDRGKFKEDSIPYRATAGAENVVFKSAEATVTICEALRNALVSRVRDPNALHVVANGADSDKFVPREDSAAARERYGLQGKRVIGYIGTFQPYEGLDLLIESMSEIARAIPEAHLVITGAHGQEEQLKALTRERGLDNLVTFTGRVPHDQVYDLYSIASLMAYPRIRTRTTELTTPLKPLEAMSMERPVIVSDVPAMGELVRDGETGFTFRAGDVHHLAQRIVAVLQDPERLQEVGRNARAWILQERDWQTLLSRYASIYEQAIATRKAR
ncbi:glycosyltransferase [Chondromyces apiculatus]|uniref:Glycosyl transferase, group 1 n=1 Tax=Chondromyces apiculatus DSM 436 TaxID=1192034 RepID=A0A017T2G9_9BACT|nr:glycosyltransferase [Chondromyces apiculatus]EYF03025.1 Glycosyl transferase, group 1 [Chondromyces apiculatus DSM 436]